MRSVGRDGWRHGGVSPRGLAGYGPVGGSECGRALRYGGSGRRAAAPTSADERLPLIKALDLAPEAGRAEIVAILTSTEPSESDWTRVVEFVEEHGGVAAAQETAHEYSAQAP